MGARRRIFISYRRDDAPGDARSIRDRLARKFGERNVFMDVDNLLAGQRFDRELDKALARCEVLIAIIGPRWMEVLVQKDRSTERDYVRAEIAAALKRDIIVIPVLVGQEGRMPALPRQADLPEDIHDLVMYQKHAVIHETFGRNLNDLIAAIETVQPASSAWSRGIKLAAAGAVALTLLVPSLLYWPQIAASWQSRGPAPPARSVADDAKSVASANTGEATTRLPGADASARNEENLVTECDLLAAAPLDDAGTRRVVGVPISKIDTQAAIKACDEAMRLHPSIARFAFQAGRAADAQNDYARAADLYRSAAARGHAGAMNNLGYLYQQGEGTAVDFAEARKWYDKAIALGDSAAMNNMGRMYEGGEGVAQSYTEALKWYRDAASLGEMRAMRNMGLIYEAGRGVPVNYAEARKWYERAAATGYDRAMVSVGSLYENGRGVTKDTKRAREWYSKAAAAGNQEAKNKLEALKD